MGPERESESSSESPNGRARTPSQDSHGGTAISGASFCCPHCANSIQFDPKAHDSACPHCGGTIDAVEHGTTVGHVRTVGRFQRFDKLGQGGFGDVWRAWDPELERHVAIKFLHKALTASETARERFRREARAVSQLRHPGIAPLYEAVELEGTPALVYQFIEGLTLAERLKVHRFDCRDAAGLVAEIAEALDYAHEMKVIHRDVKPGNIMLDESPSSSGSGVISGISGVSSPRGRAVLVDFGLAMREEMESDLTQEGQVVGTPAYMSPEQAAGKNVKEVDRRSDVYSAGVVLYELICHRRPFDGSKRVILHQVAHEEPQRPRRIDRTIDRDLENICLMAMEKDPAKRYSTAREMADDLRRYLAGEPVKARRASWPERAWRWCRRNPAVAALMLAVAVSLTGGAGVASYFAVRALNYAGQLETEKNAAIEAKALSDRRRYAAEMNNAYQSWKAGQVPFLDEILDSQERSLRGPEWHLLERFCHLDLRTLRGHEGAVQAVAVSPDARYLASAGADGTVRIWSMATWEQMRSLSRPAHSFGGGQAASTLAYSPDGKLLASAARFSDAAQGSATGLLRVWDTTTWQEAHRTRPGVIGGIAFAPRGRQIALALGIHEPGSARGRGEVDLWNLADDKGPRKFVETSAPIEGLAFSPDGKLLAGAARLNATIEVWETASGRKVRTLEGHEAPVMRVSFAPDSHHVASASWDKTARIWDLNDVGRSAVLRGHTGPVLSVSFSPDGRWLATASMDETVKLWDTETTACLTTWRGHTAPAGGVAFSPDGWRLVSASDDGTIKIWGATADAEAAILAAPKADDRPVTCLDFHPDGRLLACDGWDRCVRIWSMETGKEARTLRGHVAGVTAACYDPTGRKVASGADGVVRVFDVVTGKELWSRLEHNGHITSVAWSPDGLIIASSSEDQTIRLWEAASGTPIRTLAGHAFPVHKLAFSPDGETLISAAGARVPPSGEIKLWNVSTAEEKTICRQGSDIAALAVSPDGRWIAWGSSDGRIRVAYTADGNEPRILRGHTSAVTGLAFGPDSQRLVSSGDDKTLRFWDPSVGQLIMTLTGDDALKSMAVSRDGRWIASGSSHADIKVWDAAPLGPALNQQREALALVRYLYAQHLTPEEAAARVRNDQGISESLRAAANDLSRAYFRCLVLGRANEVIEAKAMRFFLRPDILESIRSDPQIDEIVRTEALRAAEQFVEDSEAMKAEIWRIVRSPQAPAPACRRALLLAQAGVRLVHDGHYISALGAAQYRNGMITEALATLAKAERINTNVSGSPTVADLAFLAMARYRLAQKTEAAETLARLRSLRQMTGQLRFANARCFLNEAEALIAGK